MLQGHLVYLVFQGFYLCISVYCVKAKKECYGFNGKVSFQYQGMSVWIHVVSEKYFFAAYFLA